MEHPLNPFDRQIKDAYEGFEAPYDNASWDQISKQLDTMAPSPVKYFTALTSGIAAAGLVFMALLYMLSEGPIAVSPAPTTVEPIAEQHGEVVQTSQSVGTLPGVNSQKGAVQNETEQDSAGTSEEAAPDQINDDKLASNQTSAAPSKEASSGSKHLSSTASQNATKAGSGNNQTAEKPAPRPIHSDKIITGTDASNKRAVHTSCKGLTIQFEASQEYGKDAKFLWNFGDGFFSNEANPSHTFNKPGTFDVSLSVTSYTTGQISSNVVQAKIEVIETPRARMNLLVAGPDRLQLENNSLGDDHVMWRIDGNAQDKVQSTQLPFSGKGDHEVELIVMNASGCTDTLNQRVRLHNAAAQTIDRVQSSPFTGTGEGSWYIFDSISGKLVHSAEGPTVWSGENVPGTYLYMQVVQGIKSTEIYRGQLTVK